MPSAYSAAVDRDRSVRALRQAVECGLEEVACHGGGVGKIAGLRKNIRY
jgi:hypothetical protein